jgi:hypothetical protein
MHPVTPNFELGHLYNLVAHHSSGDFAESLLPQEALGHTVVYQPLDITSQASIDALASWVEAQGG